MANNQPPVTDNKSLNAWLIEATKNIRNLQDELIQHRKDILDSATFAEFKEKVDR
jgi:hypothetical protein